MRWPLLFLIATLSTLSAADTRFVRVWPQWRDAAAFDRISQYFGRDEAERKEIVLRSRPDERAGLYFVIRVDAAGPIAGGRLVLDIIRPDSPDSRQFTFPVSLGAKDRVLEVGLTGEDWPGGADVHPVAWRLSLVDHDGQTLAVQKSFLWENPAK